MAWIGEPVRKLASFLQVHWTGKNSASQQCPHFKLKQWYICIFKATHLAIYTVPQAWLDLGLHRFNVFTKSLALFAIWWVIDGWLRLPDYTQHKTRFCDKIIFQLCSTKYASKVIQIILDKFKTKILRPTLMISICQICEAIARYCIILRVKSMKLQNLTFPIMIEPVHS